MLVSTVFLKTYTDKLLIKVSNTPNLQSVYKLTTFAPNYYWKGMKRILIIDDNAENREILELLFEDEGYTTKQLSIPENIETVIAEFLPDLILMDVMMGIYNGIEVCQRIKSIPAFNQVKVILLTASNAFLKLDKSTSLADGYISKPFDIKEVVAMVSDLLS